MQTKSPTTSRAQNSVLVLPVTKRDADAIQRLLAGEEITCMICDHIQHLCEELKQSVGADHGRRRLQNQHQLLAKCLGEQPFGPICRLLCCRVLGRSRCYLPR